MVWDLLCTEVYECSGRTVSCSAWSGSCVLGRVFSGCVLAGCVWPVHAVSFLVLCLFVFFVKCCVYCCGSVYALVFLLFVVIPRCVCLFFVCL